MQCFPMADEKYVLISSHTTATGPELSAELVMLIVLSLDTVVVISKGKRYPKYLRYHKGITYILQYRIYSISTDKYYFFIRIAGQQFSQYLLFKGQYY